MIYPHVVETQDPPREIYRLWKTFTHPTTGHYAVSVSTSNANTFISFYTIIIGLGVAFLWVLLVSLAILFFTPRKMTRTTYVALIVTWSQSEPWTASWVLAQHSWRVFRGAMGREHPAELTWMAFLFDMSLLSVALATAGAGIALGPVLARSFTVGNIAPVNPDIVYFPQYSSYADQIQRQRVTVEYDGLAALKAFRSVDGAETESEVNGDIVKVDSQPLEAVNGEDRYSIQYSYKVSGKDMGLQKLRDLTLEVSGNCSFQDTWWYAQDIKNDTVDIGGETFYDIYINWDPATLVQYPDIDQTIFDAAKPDSRTNNGPIYVPMYPRAPPAANFISPTYTKEFLYQETGRSYFVIFPLTARLSTVGKSTDPWYATEASVISTLMSIYPDMVKPARPPLLCQEDNEWSFGSWKGKMQNLISDGSDGPPVDLPAAIRTILQTGVGALPMVVNLGRALKSASLQSVTRLVGEEGAIDSQNAKASDDITRLVHAAYLATTDIFHNAAIAGSVLKAQISNGVLDNAIVNNATRKPIDGAGDFVITSGAVRALSVRALIAIPIVVTVLGVLVIVSQAGRKVKAHNVTSGHQGRMDRYVKLVAGLKAAQLYRMVDQLLADRAPSDLEGWDSKHHKNQAQWTNQVGEFPFVAPDEHANPDDEIVLPYFHIQVKGPVGYPSKDQRLTLDVTRRREDVAHWRSLRPGDGNVLLDHLDRQRDEEQEFRVNDEDSQLEPLIRNRPTSFWNRPTSMSDTEKGTTRSTSTRSIFGL